MATRTPVRELTADQERQFLDQGYVVVEQAVARDLAEQWRGLAFRRLGYDPDDPATWSEPRVHLPVMNRQRVADVAPRAWAAICDLLGGEHRIKNGPDYSFGDSFIINFPPRRGRTVGTAVAEGGGLAQGWRLLPPLPGQPGAGSADHRALVGYQATQRRHLRRRRLITNPAVALTAPMNFDRDDSADYSLVERAVLRALGVERLDFRPTAPRERVVPEREAIQARMLAEQQQRLGLS